MNTTESTDTNIFKKVYAETSKVACEIFQKGASSIKKVSFLHNLKSFKEYVD